MVDDPVYRVAGSGMPYIKFMLASNRNVYDKSRKQYADSVTYIDCIAFGDVAKNIRDTATQGCKVIVTTELIQNVIVDEYNRKCTVPLYVVNEIEYCEPIPEKKWSSSVWRNRR